MWNRVFFSPISSWIMRNNGRATGYDHKARSRTFTPPAKRQTLLGIVRIGGKAPRWAFRRVVYTFTQIYRRHRIDLSESNRHRTNLEPKPPSELRRFTHTGGCRWGRRVDADVCVLNIEWVISPET